MTLKTSKIIFDFNKNSNIKEWRIVNDGVMGGLSEGSFTLSPDGHGLFEGEISLENNGGFTSVRHRFDKLQVTAYSYISIHLKGDGKKCQFRVKDDSSTNYSYINTFATSGEWEEIRVSPKDMYPSFRGRKLDLPNFSKEYIEEIVFLIGNKRTENFQLLIDKITLHQPQSQDRVQKIPFNSIIILITIIGKETVEDFLPNLKP